MYQWHTLILTLAHIRSQFYLVLCMVLVVQVFPSVQIFYPINTVKCAQQMGLRNLQYVTYQSYNQQFTIYRVQSVIVKPIITFRK